MLKLLIAGDMHLKLNYPADTGFNGMLTKLKDPWGNFQRVLDHQAGQDALILTGDLCNDGTIEDYTALRQYLNEHCHIPLLVTLGNHDRKEQFCQVFLPGQQVHACRQILDLGEYIVISVDTSVYGNPDGCLAASELAWLQAQLSAYKGKRIIVVTHHPLIADQSEIPSLPGADQLRSVLNQDVVLIITGHTHHYYEGSYNGIPYLTAGSTSLTGSNATDGEIQFTTDSSFALAEIDASGVQIQKINIADTPVVLGSTRFI